MKSRTLFSIILKVIGLFLIKDILISLLSVFQTIAYAFEDNDFFPALIAVIIVAGIIYIAYVFIFKNDLIIGKLKLAHNIEEDISLNIDSKTVLSISIFILGGLILVDAVPEFLQNLYSFYYQKRLSLSITPDKSFMIRNGAKILIGLLLLGNQKAIVNYIEQKRAKQ